VRTTGLRVLAADAELLEGTAERLFNPARSTFPRTSTLRMSLFPDPQNRRYNSTITTGRTTTQPLLDTDGSHVGWIEAAIAHDREGDLRITHHVGHHKGMGTTERNATVEDVQRAYGSRSHVSVTHPSS
jgi:hypothetical protein